ncbi:MAG TPA: SDR family oxidoreductase [Actinospica sp.]|jgi:3-oxoacyl-[acyl-carrier protein] reductase|nr:SDR family oxidoreductase [Actinospica sp.]
MTETLAQPETAHAEPLIHTERRIAVVTGGASGMGRAISVALADSGHTVLIADPKPTDLVHGDHRYYRCAVDVGDPAGRDVLVEDVLGRFGRCDVLVNNAAYQAIRTFSEVELEEWRRFQAVNVEAPLMLTKAFAPGMAERRFGRIINILSNTVWQPPAAGLLSYITTKAAMLGFTRALAVELGEDGITVNAVAPGLTDTPGARSALTREFFREIRQRQAVPHTTQPEDVAALVAFLASDAARAITGQAIRVDGGLVTL